MDAHTLYQRFSDIGRRFIHVSSLFLGVLTLFQSCRTKDSNNTAARLPIGHSDELDIIYYLRDTLICKTNDTATISFFSEMISDKNEKIPDTCDPSGELNFKNNGQMVFSAVITADNFKKDPGCEYISYHFGSKNYRHRLTYRIGMALDGIYWSKIDPVGNPSNWQDSAGFRFEQHTHHPPRRPGIPKQAVWIGGPDGGSWYLIIKAISKRAFRIKIFNDHDGSLETNAIFALKPGCYVERIDSAELLNTIDAYDGKMIYLHLSSRAGKCCVLAPQ